MRVLHVVTALGVGGAERMLMKLLQAQALADVEQHVIAMLPGGALFGPMRAAGASVHELNFLGAVPVLAGSARLAALARRVAPDLVHGWLYHGNLGALLARAAQRRRVPVVWGIRQSLASLAGENAWARTAIRLNRRWSDCPDCLLFNSLTSLEQHRAFGFDVRRARYLPNGFECSKFAPDDGARARLRAEWAVPDGAVVFGMLARHHPAKDHAGLLTAARHVLATRPDCRFVLAGPGVDADNATLRDALEDSALADRVQLLGARSDVPQVLAALDVYVSSSAWIEAFSNSVGEAMSCGLPCIVTDVGDSPQLVSNTGRVVPPRDPAALAAAMLEMVDIGAAARAQLGRRARERIVAEYDIAAVATRHAGLWREMAAAQSERR